MASGSRLRRDFIAGLLVVLPVIGTAWILLRIFLAITGVVFDVVHIIQPIDTIGLVILVRVASLALLVAGILFVGFLARNVFGRRLLSVLEAVCDRIPVFNRLYHAIRQILRAIVAEDRAVFKYVVLVEYPRPGIYAVGFVTAEGRGEVQQKTAADLVNVFIPTTPNPTSGLLILVPRGQLIRLGMSIEEGMKLVISGGTLVPGAPS
ncbi:MAG: DUF502 domain-containing protein [bacterium]|nr:DUF502 domain-containing protein [bacterium]